jgi:20S proteasome alpha/beta subunit
MGTTLISIKYNGGVIMASDCMTSSGNFVSDRAAKKVMELSPSPIQFGSIKVIRCGTAAHSQMVSRFVYNYLNMFCMELNPTDKLSIETVV